MKMFLADNLSVEDRAVKFAASASSATSLEGALYHDWAEAQSIWQIVDATLAYAMVYHCGTNFRPPWRKINYDQSLSPIFIKLVLKFHLILYFSKLTQTF